MQRVFLPVSKGYLIEREKNTIMANLQSDLFWNKVIFLYGDENISSLEDKVVVYKLYMKKLYRNDRQLNKHVSVDSLKLSHDSFQIRANNRNKLLSVSAFFSYNNLSDSLIVFCEERKLNKSTTYRQTE